MHKNIGARMGSLFDGSGGFPLAASMCGVTPIWASEVEPYPIAVTRSRFPEMKHLGDVSEISGGDIEPVDIITFGSPCQDMSIAGKRAGIRHTGNGDNETTRSGLFMEAARIITEMRRATNGMYPTFAVWENVPGAFSSNRGEDFRLVLETLVQIIEPNASMPPVPKGGWPRADCYCGDGWSIAYRTFDAQYWGVPQRRRRIYLVADFRGERAGKILFERPGLRWNFETSGTPWEKITADAERGAGTSDCAEPMTFHMTQDPISISGKAPCITQGSNTGEATIGVVISAGFKANQGAKAGSIGWKEERSCTINADTPGLEPTVCIAFAQNQRDGTRDLKEATGILAAEPGMKQQTFIAVAHDSRGYGDGKTVGTITGDHESRVTDYTTVVCIQDGVIGRGLNAGPGGCGIRADGNAYTLDTKQPPAVCFALQQFGRYKESRTTSTLQSRDFKGGADIVISADERSKDTSLTPWDTQSRRVYSEDGIFPALSAREKEGQNQQAVFTHYIVRRLTPTECARLQGFPDKWGHLDHKEEFTEEEYRFWLGVRNTHAEINGKATREYTKEQMLTWYNRLHTDSAEYKMWGNGITLPCALYVMEGIAAELHTKIFRRNWPREIEYPGNPSRLHQNGAEKEENTDGTHSIP